MDKKVVRQNELLYLKSQTCGATTPDRRYEQKLNISVNPTCEQDLRHIQKTQ
jgi:translation initiation factor 2 beta subunit (eIF-2beta)/eIF-5